MKIKQAQPTFRRTVPPLPRKADGTQDLRRVGPDLRRTLPRTKHGPDGRTASSLGAFSGLRVPVLGAIAGAALVTAVAPAARASEARPPLDLDRTESEDATRSALDRLVDRGKRAAWKALTTHTVDGGSSVDVGRFGAVGIEASEGARRDLAWDADRAAFETSAKAEGKDVLWLESGGKLSFETDAVPTLGVAIEAELGLRYTVTRPYTYPAGHEDVLEHAVALGKALAKNTVDLPSTPARALELERGSRFAIEAFAEPSLSLTDLGIDRTDVRLRDRVHVEVERVDGNKVEVLWSRVTESLLNGHARNDGTEPRFDLANEVELDLDANLSRRFERRFVLDLSKDSGKRAYEDLLRLRLDKATTRASTSTDGGVRVESEYRGHKLWSRLSNLEGLAGRLELGHEKVDRTDARVKDDVVRRDFTKARESEGREVRWVDTRGAVEPKFTYRTRHPVATGLNAEHGFTASVLVEYRGIHPEVDGRPEARGPALNAEEASRLAPGTEFALKGVGKIRGFAGLRGGAEWASPGVSIGLSGGLESGHEESRGVELRVRALDTNKLRVSLTHLDGDEDRVSLSARLGADFDSSEIPGLDTLVRSLDGLDKLSEKVDERLEKLVRVELSHAHSNADDHENTISFDLDMSTAIGRKSYEHLLTLDAQTVAGWAKNATPGLRWDRTIDVRTDTTRAMTTFSVAGSKLYLRDALRKDTTRIVTKADDVGVTDHSVYEERGHGLLGRERHMAWEAVSVRTAGDPVGRAYYRLSFDNEDPFTSKDEARAWKRLSEVLGAAPEKPVRIEADKGRNWFVEHILGDFARHGTTKSSMEIFFTEKGIDALRKLDRVEAIAEAGRAAAEREGKPIPAWASSDKAAAAKAQSALDNYIKASRKSTGPKNNGSDMARVARAGSAYREATGGHSAWDERDTYGMAKSFANMVDRMRTSASPADWNKAFADLGEEVGYDFYDVLATIHRVVGAEELLVHRFTMKGDAVDLEMRDEGLLKRPAYAG